jgi:hypothetical protein
MKYFGVNNLHRFHAQSWSAVKRAYQVLADLRQKFGVWDESQHNVWKYSGWLEELIAKGMEGEDPSGLFEWEKQALGLLDVELVRSFKDDLEAMAGFFAGQRPLPAVRKEPEAEQTRPATTPPKFNQENLRLFGLADNLAVSWLNIYKKIDQKSQQTVAELFSSLWEEEEELSYELADIAVVTGVGQAAVKPYSVAELSALYGGQKANYHPHRLIRTMVDSMNSDSWKEVATILLTGLNSEERYGQTVFEWEEALLLNLTLHFVYNRFYALSEEQQDFLLENYFYRAVVVGAPAREKISEALYYTLNMVDYIYLNMLFYNALERNSERVSTNIASGTDTILGLLFNKFLNFNKSQTSGGFEFNQYISNIYQSQPGRDAYIFWLEECFFVFLHLSRADLIDHNRGGELKEIDIYRNEMLELVSMFGIGKDGASFIVNYFQQDNKKITFSAFLRQLEGIVDLKQSVAVENCLELSAIFHQAGLLPTHQDLVVYDEKSESFHWSESLGASL